MTALRDRLDVSGIVTGLAFVLLGIGFLLDELDVLELDADVVVPAVLMALGAAVLLGTLLPFVPRLGGPSARHGYRG